MPFFLFILVNAALFIRPAEVFGLKEFENLYQFLILACLVVSLPRVLAYLTSRPLDAQPITLCVFGVLLAIPLPFLASQQLGEAFRTSLHFFKVVAYFLLLASLVDTPRRLLVFLRWILVLALFPVIVSVLSFQGVVQLNVNPLSEFEVDAASGEYRTILRLQGTGIFQDPNEMCVLIAALLPLCLFFFLDKRGGLLRALWLAELLLFGYAMALTGSRGGFLALIAGLGVLAWARLGGARALALGALGLPVLLILFAGRQTNLDPGAGTAKTRIGHWSDWMMVFRENPLFGAGMPLVEHTSPDQVSEIPQDHLAHNSFLQGFADMGVLGGVAFLGAFLVAGWILWRLGRAAIVVDADARRLQPFLLGTLAAYAAGLLSLSLCYTVPTYLFLGLAAAFANGAACHSSGVPLRLSGGVMRRMLVCSGAYLVAMYLFIRVFNVGA